MIMDRLEACSNSEWMTHEVQTRVHEGLAGMVASYDDRQKPKVFVPQRTVARGRLVSGVQTDVLK
jgi:hypothetical protein